MSEPAAPRPPEDLLDTAKAGPAAVRGGVLRVAGYGFGAALSVISASLLFRHLGVADAGRYVTVTTLVALFGGVTEAGLWSISVRELSVTAGAPARRDLMRDIVGLRLALSTAAGLVAIGFAAASGYAPVMVAGAALCALGMVVQNVQLTWSAALAARLRFGWVAGLDLVRQVVSVGGIILLVLAGAGLLPLLALAVPAAIAVAVPTALLVRSDVSLAPRLDPAVWRRLLRDVLPFAAATAVGALYFRVSLILVSLITVERQTAFFAVSFRIVEVLVVVPLLMVSAALPIFARAAVGDGERLRFGIQRVLDTTAIFGAVVVLGVFVAADDIIAIVAGSDFGPAATVLRIQCLGLLGTFVSAVWGYGLLSLGRHRALLLLVSVPLVLNVVLTLALAPLYGARGGATATVVGELALAVAGLLLLARAIAPHRVAVLPMARAFALAVPFTALALVDGGPLLLTGVVAAALYLLAIWALGWLPANLMKDLLGS